MSKVDDELSRRLQRAERPMDSEGLFEELSRRRSHIERVRRAQAALLAFAVLAATAGGFLFLRDAFEADKRNVGDDQTPSVTNGEIVFSRGLPDGSEHVFAVQPGVAGEQLITSGGAIYADPSVAPDGRAIAVVHSLPRFADMNAEGVIATFTMDGGEPLWITDPLPRVGDPSWSPEGDRIAFAASTSNGRLPGIYVIDADGSDMRLVVKLDGVTLSAPDWSPDGKSLVFVALSASESEADLMEPDIYRVGLDGTGLTNLTQTPAVGEWSPSWAPTGSGIAFHRNDPTKRNRIQIMDIQGRHIRTVFDESGSIEIGELDWSPDGERIAFTSSLALTDADADGDLDVWTIRIDGTELTNLTTAGASGISWQPVPAGSEPQPSPTSEPTVSPSAEPAGRDIGLGFNVCNLQRLSGIDFLGDGTMGSAWTGTKVKSNGTCPTNYDDRYGVAVDYTGDGVADSWSGDTIEYCGGCEPWKAMDLNGDGSKELIVIVEYFSIMHYGVYAFLDVNGRPEIEPFRIGEPGHPEHQLDPGKPFTFWVGGDAGLSDWFYCETLPEFWLTGTESPIEPAPGDVKTIHRTHVSLMTDGIAHILFADTYTVPAETHLELPYTSPDHSEPTCGLRVGLR
jgi:Tol biopolymer transport system component